MAIIILGNPDLTAEINKAMKNSTFALLAKIDAFKQYVYYLNENHHLKFSELVQYRTPNGSWIYYCKFSEPAFVLGVFMEGQKKTIPSHALNNLTPKEIAFQTFPYFKETWIETEDFRKVDSYFAFTNTNFNP